MTSSLIKRVVDEVLVSGAVVADRLVAELVERRDVGERRQLFQGVADERGGTQLLLGSHALDPAEVDRLRRVECSWPVHRHGGGRLGLLAVAVGVAVVARCGDGRPGTGGDGSFVAMTVRVVDADEHRRQRDDADGERR